ncbi:MAG: hypothetical protein ABI743_08070 [bacterium]
MLHPLMLGCAALFMVDRRLPREQFAEELSAVVEALAPLPGMRDRLLTKLGEEISAGDDAFQEATLAAIGEFAGQASIMEKAQLCRCWLAALLRDDSYSFAECSLLGRMGTALELLPGQQLQFVATQMVPLFALDPGPPHPPAEDPGPLLPLEREAMRAAGWAMVLGCTTVAFADGAIVGAETDYLVEALVELGLPVDMIEALVADCGALLVDGEVAFATVTATTLPAFAATASEPLVAKAFTLLLGIGASDGAWDYAEFDAINLLGNALGLSLSKQLFHLISWRLGWEGQD